MRFALAKEHIEFFTKHGFIQFDDLFKASYIEEYKKQLEKILSQRLEMPYKFLHTLDPERLFSEGRDLWRDSKELESIFRSQSVCDIIKELFQQRSIRLGYTQYLPHYTQSSSESKGEKKYLHYIDSHPTLQLNSSIQGIVGGAIICLTGAHSGDEEEATQWLPRKIGSVIFFEPEFSLDLNQLQMSPDKHYLLIAYAIPNSVYISNPSDPHTHFLKKYEYNIGDKLLDKRHPILTR